MPKGQKTIIEYRGERHSVYEWAKILGIKQVTLYKRLKTKSVEEAFTMPLMTAKQSIALATDKHRKLVEYEGQQYSIQELAKKLGLSYGAVSKRLQQGELKPRRGLITANNETHSVTEWAKILGISRVAVYKRLQRMSPDEALRKELK